MSDPQGHRGSACVPAKRGRRVLVADGKVSCPVNARGNLSFLAERGEGSAGHACSPAQAGKGARAGAEPREALQGLGSGPSCLARPSVPSAGISLQESQVSARASAPAHECAQLLHTSVALCSPPLISHTACLSRLSGAFSFSWDWVLHRPKVQKTSWHLTSINDYQRRKESGTSRRRTDRLPATPM